MALTSPNAILSRLEKLLNSKIRPLFRKYDQDIGNLLTPLKWKPLVLVIGNYSSGKSTFINELLGEHIQRVGQAPTDDSFTILCKPEADNEEKDIPGTTVVNDDRLPFGVLRQFGERLFSHMKLKYVDSPILHEIAIIDTPGMLDSVTEKDRGYDYLNVIGELARLSDVIILMFDPHKAGTIKETYQAIRSTLPGSTGEDRIFYVMNRIDECENSADLVKSYGTLCWNLSQMTGRKDIPRIFLTFTDEAPFIPEGFETWKAERQELKHSVQKAPQLRVNHIFEEIDRGLREFATELTAYAKFKSIIKNQSSKVFRFCMVISIILFLAGDIGLKMLIDIPEKTFFQALLARNIQPENLLIPLGFVAIIMIMGSFYLRNIIMPWQTRHAIENLESLVSLDTAYKKDLWKRVQPRIEEMLRTKPRFVAWAGHRRILRKVERFINRDLRKLFEKYQPTNEKES